MIWDPFVRGTALLSVLPVPPVSGIGGIKASFLSGAMMIMELPSSGVKNCPLSHGFSASAQNIFVTSSISLIVFASCASISDAVLAAFSL